MPSKVLDEPLDIPEQQMYKAAANKPSKKASTGLRSMLWRKNALLSIVCRKHTLQKAYSAAAQHACRVQPCMRGSGVALATAEL
jgi:hypothetical protein